MAPENDGGYKVYEFGWWPELIGVIGVAVLVHCLFEFARGSI
ncbi:MAG: hypothetical protein AAF580_10505 [Pseudomonadota bacterium]